MRPGTLFRVAYYYRNNTGYLLSNLDWPVRTVSLRKASGVFFSASFYLEDTFDKAAAVDGTDVGSQQLIAERDHRCFTCSTGSRDSPAVWGGGARLAQTRPFI